MFLPAKHQTLLKIAYPITRPAFKHCTIEYLEKHRLSKEASGLYPLRKLQNVCIRRMLKGWLQCNHILFDSSVSNILPAKHQTLLKIAYPITRPAFKHCTIEYLEKHRLSKKASGLYPLRKLQNFCIRRLLKSWLHCNHILFGPSLSNFCLQSTKLC